MADNGRSAQPALAQPASKVLADLSERVNQMEVARERGVSLIGNIIAALKKSKHSMDVVDNWTQIADELIKAIKDQSLLVGLCGETGLGKSTLINALLDKNIAPTSSVEACTASVCVFAYNKEVDPEKAFQAMIIFKSVNTIKAELLKTLDEMWELEATEEEDIDAEFRARAEAVRQNIKVVEGWSGLTEEEIRIAKSEQEITRKSKHKVFKARRVGPDANYHEEINAESLPEFRKKLAPYIQGKVGKGIDWPLVELVRVCVKAPVLEHGIKLVDLPGSMDALESRCAISKQYMWNLNKRIVAVHANRATDSKTAMDLMLSSTEIMDMQLDNQLGQDSLAVAVNQIDSMDVTNGEEEWADDEEALGELYREMEDINNECSDLNEQLQGVQEEIADLRTSGDPGDDARGDEGSFATLKRGWGDGPPTDLQAMKDLENKLGRLKKRRDMIASEQQRIKTQIKRRCILARNQRIVKNFARHFKDSQYSPGLSVGNVFPNSAACYNVLKQGSECPEFEDRESTGVDALRRWIIEVSLPHREEGAKSHLQQMNILFDAADGWMRYHDDKTDKCTLSRQAGADALRLLSSQTDSMSKDVLAAMETASDNLLTEMTTLQARRPISSRSRAGDEEIDTALAKFAHYVELSGMVEPKNGRKRRMPWVTYRKCLRLHGREWAPKTKKSKKGGAHRWMDSIYESFWGPFKDKWLVMLRDLTNIESQFTDDVHKCFSAFVDQLPRQNGVSGEFHQFLKQEVYTIKHELEAFVTFIRQEFSIFRVILREHQTATRTIFEQSMTPAFDKALQEKGPGSYVKQLEIMAAHIESINPDMFKNTLDNLERKIVNNKVMMVENIKKRWENHTKDKMKSNLLRIVCSVCPSIRADNPELGDLANTLVKKPGVRNAITGAIADWNREWKRVEPQLPKPKGGTTRQHGTQLGKQQMKAEARGSDKKSKNSKALGFNLKKSFEETGRKSNVFSTPMPDGRAGGSSILVKDESE